MNTELCCPYCHEPVSQALAQAGADDIDPLSVCHNCETIVEGSEIELCASCMGEGSRFTYHDGTPAPCYACGGKGRP